MHAVFDCDVAIVGTGPVACALVTALARRSFTRTLRVALIGPHRTHTPIDADDPRAIALSYGSRMLLEPAWPAHATPIHRIHISQQGHFGRAAIDRKECALPALGYVVRYSALLRCLGESAQAHVETQAPGWLAMAAGIPTQDKQGVTLPLTLLSKNSTTLSTTPSSIRTQLLIYAEGSAPPQAASTSCTAESAVGSTAGSAAADTVRYSDPAVSTSRHIHNYHQTALIGIVRVDAPHPHTAWERFTPEGPLALLPMGGLNEAEYALVWCSTPETAQRRLQATPEHFLAELGSIFGSRMGTFLSITHRTSFPLMLQKQHSLVNGRIASIGNAAQTLHPVAGQGLNLGLRDAWTLAQSLTVGATPEALASFAQHRQSDRQSTVRITHFLANAFICPTRFPSPFPSLYSAGLTLLDHLPPLKTAFANQMIFGRR